MFNQIRIELGVDVGRFTHHVFVEELEDDEFYLDTGLNFVAGILERITNGFWTQRVVVLGKIGVVEQLTHSGFQAKQLFFAPHFDLADHVGDRQGLFEILVVYQSEIELVVVGQLKVRMGLLRPGHFLLEAGGQLFPVEVFHCGAFETHLPHGLEIMGLGTVGVRFLSQLEQRIVDLVHHPGNGTTKTFEYQLAAPRQ